MLPANCYPLHIKCATSLLSAVSVHRVRYVQLLAICYLCTVSLPRPYLLPAPLLHAVCYLGVLSLLCRATCTCYLLSRSIESATTLLPATSYLLPLQIKFATSVPATRYLNILCLLHPATCYLLPTACCLLPQYIESDTSCYLLLTTSVYRVRYVLLPATCYLCTLSLQHAPCYMLSATSAHLVCYVVLPATTAH